MKKKVRFDYSRLKGRIVEIFGTAGRFAEALGFKPNMLTARMRNGTPWKDCEIYAACELLGISPEEIPVYFFAVKF